MYANVFMEVSGICNSRCPWCVTGARSKLHSPGRFIEKELFERALSALQEKKLVTPSSVVHLYNWGEAFLHPQLKEILTLLAERKMQFSISTNCSRATPLSPSVLPWLSSVIFSVPGFSQKSFDRINGFELAEVKRRISDFADQARANGYNGMLRMAYHMYQFNLDEIPEALRFCRQHSINFAPVLANWGDFDMACKYALDELDSATLKRAGKELFLYYFDDLRKQRPENYTCSQHDCLAIDEDCQVLTCCALPRKHEEYAIGSLFDLTANEIAASKRARKVCGMCGELGLDYLGANPVVPQFLNQFSSFVEQDYDSVPLARELRSHFDAMVSSRLGPFVQSLGSIAQTSGMSEALKHYREYRWCFPDVEALRKVDEIMSQASQA